MKILFAFIAGFLAVPTFHQITLAVLHALGLTQAAPWPMQSTWPLGVPQLWSLAFWGGLWGILFAIIVPRIANDVRYWMTALAFGAIGPTAIAWLVVTPLKGGALSSWRFSQVVVGLLVNAAWGIGTALFLYWIMAAFKWRARRHAASRG